MSETEPLYDIAHLGHVELFTPKIEESLRFFTEVYGLELVGTVEESVYLRAWGDHDLTTLKLTAAGHAGVAHVGWRATSNQALDRRVRALEAAGVDGEWIEGDLGHGKAYSFRAPSGHRMEVYYEAAKYVPSHDQRPFLPNQPQKFAPRGAAVHAIDHINLLAPDVVELRTFMEQHLGFKLRERLVPR